MKKIIPILFVLFSFDAFSQTSNYDLAWKAINENNKPVATDFLTKALAERQNFVEAYITNMYLQEYNGKESESSNFLAKIFEESKNPYPYIYSLWFNSNVAGPYGKKQMGHQLALLDKLISDDKSNGTLKAAAYYQKGMHLVFANQLDKAQLSFNEIYNIRNWQFTGPFENLSESGYYKNYGPLDHPEPASVFKSLTNADVKWFSPSQEDKSGWVPISYQFNNSNAVVYAQTFVTSTSDKRLLLNLAASGSVKLWLNDELLISESKELITEFDAYSIPCDLKAGVNRILVQLGYSNISYPNFTVRFTDDNYNAVKDLSGSPIYKQYEKYAGVHRKHQLLPHFAESYFQNLVEKAPNDLVNYLLLADAYLRSRKLEEARKLINKGLLIAPNNPLLRNKLVEVLSKDNNRTLYLEEVEKLKKIDPNSVFSLSLKIDEAVNNQKINDAESYLNEFITLYGEDQKTIAYRIKILIAEKKYDELIKQAERLYKLFPENPDLVTMMGTIKKEVYKDNKGAIKVYEDYLKDNYNYNVVTEYANLLSSKGEESKSIGVKLKLAEKFPYDANGYFNLSEYYFGLKNYNQAELYVNKALAIAPYNETLWKQLGLIKSEQSQNTEAMIALNTSLKYDPNQYDVLNKLRKLNGQQETYKLFPQVDIDNLIATDELDLAKNKDYGYYFISDQKDVVVYPDGATEAFYTNVIRITNDKGIERYKETSIGYNNSQSLLIEKAEVIKKNKAKIEGERDENQIVFTNLEAGDVIVLKYKIQNYVYGRFAKEFWDKFYFNGQVYSSETKYNLLAPKDLNLVFNFSNSDLNPQITEVDDYKMYSWALIKPEPIKDEPLMPGIVDVGPVLHISTIKDWEEIRKWYADISNNNAEIELETKEVYANLFPSPKSSLSQFQKARIIYDYIESNIKYSSVSFRQSAFTPQRPAKTISTRLGDCKDLSSLFVSLAKMAGIDAKMVLVDTRDNGKKDLILPSIEFNHCIAKAFLDGKEYYIELTDNYLPFASLPNTLNGAAILEINSDSNSSASAKLQYLRSPTRTKDVVKRTIDIRPDQANLEISTKVTKYGNPSSSIRYTYLNLEQDKRKEEMEKAVAKDFKNNVKLTDVYFGELTALLDSVNYNYSFKVKDEIAEIGTLKTFQINYPDAIATLSQFTAEKRDYPIEYWNYEDYDEYQTIVNVYAPQGEKFVDVPANETLTFKDMKYSLKYTLVSPDKLVVSRAFSNKREDVPASDYLGFKDFFEKILKAERKFIAFK